MAFDFDFSKEDQKKFYEYIESKRKEINNLPNFLNLREISLNKLDAVHRKYNSRLIKYLNQIMEYKRNPSVNKKPSIKLNKNSSGSLDYFLRN